MPFFLRVKELVGKMQILPLWQRKVILWVVVASLGIVLILVWWNLTKEQLKRIDLNSTVEQFIPSIEEGQNKE